MKAVRVTAIFGSLFLLLLGGAWYFIKPYVSELASVGGVLPPLKSKKENYLSVVQRIERGQSRSKSFALPLPASDNGLTPLNRVYYEQRKDGRLWVLFPTWYGRGGDVQGYLYSSGTLQPSDFAGSPLGESSLTCCGFDNLSTQKIDANWYTVVRRMD